MIVIPFSCCLRMFEEGLEKVSFYIYENFAYKTFEMLLINGNTQLVYSDAFHDLVPFVQFKKREKHSWRSVTFSKDAGFISLHFTKSDTPPWAFFTFLKLYKWYRIAQSISFPSRECHITCRMCSKFTLLR